MTAFRTVGSQHLFKTEHAFGGAGERQLENRADRVIFFTESFERHANPRLLSYADTIVDTWSGRSYTQSAPQPKADTVYSI
jgi:hypothetical protein